MTAADGCVVVKRNGSCCPQSVCDLPKASETQGIQAHLFTQKILLKRKQLLMIFFISELMNYCSSRLSIPWTCLSARRWMERWLSEHSHLCRWQHRVFHLTTQVRERVTFSCWTINWKSLTLLVFWKTVLKRLVSFQSSPKRRMLHPSMIHKDLGQIHIYNKNWILCFMFILSISFAYGNRRRLILYIYFAERNSLCLSWYLITMSLLWFYAK